MKYGRNDICWCGSGRKFKKCHLDREKQEPVKHWEVGAQFRKDFSAKVCSVPAAMQGECSEQIIRAHTVPRAGSLAKIAEKGHVLGFVFSLENMIKNNGVLQPQLVGINNASTFTGFCSNHDNALFSSVEKHLFTGSQEQCFLLAYRALARESYTKLAASVSAENHSNLDQGRSISEQMRIQAISGLYGAAVGVGVEDNQHHKARFDAILTSQDFSSVRSYIITFDEPPPIMCSGAFSPETDFAGKQLQNLSDYATIPHTISVTSFYGGALGHVVFTWMPEDDPVCMPYIQSLACIPDANLASTLVRIFFETFENIHISPSWWRSLSAEQQKVLIGRMTGSVMPEFMQDVLKLKAGECVVPPWAVQERKWVGIAA